MESVAEPNNRTPCDGCLAPSSDLDELDGDQLCRSCWDVLWAAMVLWEEGITSEDEVIPTLVCARTLGLTHRHDALNPNPDLADYPFLEVVTYVRGGVPIMRACPLDVGGETDSDTHVLKRVHIQVLSKHVKPSRVREEYEQVVTEHGARWEKNNHGRFSYKVQVGPILQLTVEAGPDLTPLEVEGLGGDPFRHPAWHFPSPHLVASVYKAILGSEQGTNAKSFKYALDLYGKPQNKTPEKTIPAFVAWQIGAQSGPHAGEGVDPKSRLRVAQFLNKHLLNLYDDVPSIPEDFRNSGHVLWQDVTALWPRFVRLQSLLLQPK